MRLPDFVAHCRKQPIRLIKHGVATLGEVISNKSRVANRG